MGRIFEYFVVCGLGPEMRTLDGDLGFHGLDTNYLPSLLDQFPPSDHSLYPPPPPQLPTVSYDQIPIGFRFGDFRIGSDLMILSFFRFE